MLDNRVKDGAATLKQVKVDELWEIQQLWRYSGICPFSGAQLLWFLTKGCLELGRGWVAICDGHKQFREWKSMLGELWEIKALR